MDSSPKILAILEPDCEPDLLAERTAQIAGAFGCDVHLVLFDPDTGPLFGEALPINGEQISMLREKIEFVRDSMVNTYATKISDTGITVTTSTLTSRPLGDNILTLAQELAPKLIVKMTRYHSVAERSSMYDSDLQLLRTCPYPMWLVKQDSFPSEPVIAASVDPMHTHDKPAALDHEIIGTAKLVADKMNGAVRLFHAYQSLVGIGAAAIRATTPAILSVEEINERTRSAHDDALMELATANDVPAEAVFNQPGRTHEVLPAFARDENVSLLVMGGISRSGVQRMIVGSTAERVMDHIPCDILILRIGMHPIL